MPHPKNWHEVSLKEVDGLDIETYELDAVMTVVDPRPCKVPVEVLRWTRETDTTAFFEILKRAAPDRPWQVRLGGRLQSDATLHVHSAHFFLFGKHYRQLEGWFQAVYDEIGPHLAGWTGAN